MDFLVDFDNNFGENLPADRAVGGNLEDLEDSDDDYIDDWNEDLEIIDLERHAQNNRSYRQFIRVNYMEMWNDGEFFQRFRMSKESIVYVLSLIEPQLQNYNPYRTR